MDKLCSVAGECINFTSKIVKEYADFIPILGQVASGVSKVNTNRLNFGMLLKEAAYANNLLNTFSEMIAYMDIIEEETGIKICSLDTAKKFKIDFTELLSYYQLDFINKTQQMLTPEWYRVELQSKLSFLVNITTMVQTEAFRVQSNYERIKSIKDSKVRKIEMTKLISNFTCSVIN